MKGGGPRTVLDLDKVTLVDVHVVRFLGRCETVKNCTPPLPTLYPRVDRAGAGAVANRRNQGEQR